MTLLLGIDTGGTYTDAVLVDDDADAVVAKAKSLTTRPDLSDGIGAAIDIVLHDSGAAAQDIAMVSLSTTLATNALVEGQGGRVALIFIGFDAAELQKADLAEALGDDPVVFIDGGHSHSGSAIAPLDTDTLRASLDPISDGLTGVAIASRFATRNPEHEITARDMVRQMLGVPVTCSHELSQALGGPKRALTAVLNARLIGMIDRLIDATETHLNCGCAMADRRAKCAGKRHWRNNDGCLCSEGWPAQDRPAGCQSWKIPHDGRSGCHAHFWAWRGQRSFDLCGAFRWVGAGSAPRYASFAIG